MPSSPKNGKTNLQNKKKKEKNKSQTKTSHFIALIF